MPGSFRVLGDASPGGVTKLDWFCLVPSRRQGNYGVVPEELLLEPDCDRELLRGIAFELAPLLFVPAL